jgi:phosphoadenosine phosphosulfate reductase
MPDKSMAWRNFLIDFAKKIGKADAEVYVDSGKWKARQGGNGLAAAKTVKLQFTNCTSEEHSKIYKLFKPYDDELINMFTPFGKVAKDLGQKLLQETIILDANSNVPILSLQPFMQDGYEHAVKVKTLNVENHDELQRLAGYQIRKFNACRRCLKCESLCRTGAISIIGDSYYIDPEKCVHCYKCMNAKYLAGGCMMDKYLRTK